MDKANSLKHTALFGDLDAEALNELAAMARSRDLEPGEVLFLAGEESAGLFVIVSGQIRAYRVNSQGREQTIHVEMAGATLAEVPMFDDGPYPATAVAELPTQVLFLEKNHVRAFMLRHSHFCLTALKLMAKRLRGHAELVDALAFQQVGQRLARFLLERCRSDGSNVGLPLSVDELAKRVGSVREVVSRTLTRLEHEGLIRQQRSPNVRGRQIVITDEALLVRYSETGHLN